MGGGHWSLFGGCWLLVALMLDINCVIWLMEMI